MKARLAVSLAATLALAAGLVVAQPEKGKAPAQPEKAKSPAQPEKPKGQPEVSPEAKAMMDAYEKASKPGDQHKNLAKFEGEWDGTLEWWMAPGAPSSKHKTSCVSKMEMDGRYLRSHWRGDMDGTPFQGVSLMGYNNVRKQYQSTWVDNMSTSITSMTGSCDTAGTVFTWKGEEDDPMTGKPKAIREVMTLVDANTIKSEFFGPGPDGKEFKTMEIVVKRKSSSSSGNPAAAN